MNTRNDTGFRTFLVGSGGVTRHTRVKTPAAIVLAGAGEASIGIALETVAEGGYCAVKLWSAPGTFACTAAGVVHAADLVYGAASGKIDDTVAGIPIGTALEAAAADGDVIEVLPAAVGDATLAAQTHVADVTAITGTLTGTVNGAMVDIAATAGSCAGGSTPTATQVDTAIATAVATIVTGANEQNKELLTTLNALIGKFNTVLANLEANGIHAAS